MQTTGAVQVSAFYVSAVLFLVLSPTDPHFRIKTQDIINGNAGVAINQRNVEGLEQWKASNVHWKLPLRRRKFCISSGMIDSVVGSEMASII